MEWLYRNPDKRGQPNYSRSTVVHSNPLVPEPVYYRHAWARNPLASLKSTDLSGTPFATQRNDTFTLAEMYEIDTGKKPSNPGILNGGEQGQLIQSLKAADLARRVAEARALLDVNGGISPNDKTG